MTRTREVSLSTPFEDVRPGDVWRQKRRPHSQASIIYVTKELCPWVRMNMLNTGQTVWIQIGHFRRRFELDPGGVTLCP